MLLVNLLLIAAVHCQLFRLFHFLSGLRPGSVSLDFLIMALRKRAAARKLRLMKERTSTFEPPVMTSDAFAAKPFEKKRSMLYMASKPSRTVQNFRPSVL